MSDLPIPPTPASTPTTSLNCIPSIFDSVADVLDVDSYWPQRWDYFGAADPDDKVLE